MAVIDLTASAAVVAILAAVAVPIVSTARDRMEGLSAARYLAARFHFARLEAARRNATVGIRFGMAGAGHAMRLYVDGDGDGVRADDISRGIDPPVGDADVVSHHFPGAWFEIGAGVTAPDSGAPLPAGSDPIRFGSSDFVSFHPLGSATSGTAYLADRSGQAMAVRVFGATGRVRVLVFDARAGRWRSD